LVTTRYLFLFAWLGEEGTLTKCRIEFGRFLSSLETSSGKTLTKQPTNTAPPSNCPTAMAGTRPKIALALRIAGQR
jgi:hypothetical protein